jgi:outer membrane autotransporter protein
MWNAGSLGALEPSIYRLINLDPNSTYGPALDALMPVQALATTSGSAVKSFDFVDSLMSCHRYDANDFALREAACAWARLIGGDESLAGSTTTVAANESWGGIEGGREFAIGTSDFFGFALGYQYGSGSAAPSSTTNSNRVDLGLTWKNVKGPWTVAEGLDAAYAFNQSSRMPLAGTTATSNPNVFDLDARLRVAYLAEHSPWYLKPFADIDVLTVNAPSFTETGAGPLDLTVNTMTKVVGAVTPSLEYGESFRMANGSISRAYVAAGLRWATNATWSSSSEFAGAPAGLAPFTVSTQLPATVGKVTLGTEIRSKYTNVRVEYERRFGLGISGQSGAVQVDFKL